MSISKNNKKICFFNSNIAWGGGEKWHLTTCQEFHRLGKEPILVTNRSSKLAHMGIKSGLNVYQFSIGNLSFLNPVKILIIFLFFKIKKIDVVILNLPSDVKLAGIAAKLAKVNRIIYRRGMPHPIRNTMLNRFLFKHVLTDIIVNSQEISKSLIKSNESWFPKEKIHLIYNGVKIKSIRKRKELSSPFIIGNAGRLTEQKGQHYLIELGKLLKQEGIRFKIKIAGEGELKNKLTDLTHQYGLHEEIIFLGHVSPMEEFFESLDVFVFTSLYEGSANTLIETLQYEIPVVAWNISSNPEIIDHQKTGLLARPFDVEDLKSKVLDLLKNKELVEQFQTSGKSKVKELFDAEKNFQKLQNLIQDL